MKADWLEIDDGDLTGDDLVLYARLILLTASTGSSFTLQSKGGIYLLKITIRAKVSRNPMDHVRPAEPFDGTEYCGSPVSQVLKAGCEYIETRPWIR